MAQSAIHPSQTHEQIEYELGFLITTCVPSGEKDTTPAPSLSNDDIHRKPPLRMQDVRTKSAAGR